MARIPQRILIIRLSALGDVLFALPAVEALRRRFPEAEIDWLVEDRASTLLDLYAGLNRRRIYPRGQLAKMMRNPRRWHKAVALLVTHWRSLRENRYDLVLDLQSNLKSGLHAVFARATEKAGFGKGHDQEFARWFVRTRVRPGPEVVHRVDKGMALVRALFPEIPADPPTPPLRIPDASQQYVRAELDRSLGRAQPYVVVHPGTSKFGAFKRWAPDRFAHVGDLLARRLGLRLLITWGPGEEDLARRVLRSMKSAAGQMAPRTNSLADLAAILAGARFLIGSDSAPLHLAAFLGTPVVALFGPKDSSVYGPRFGAHRIVHTWLPCSPCTRRRCPDAFCMEEISVAQVEAAAASLFEETRPR